jgi:putative endonuclease
MNTKEIGNNGENKAADYLIEKGYSILERNWRTKTG